MKFENNWRYKSLFNLAKIDLGSAADAPTPLVKKCCELTSKPLNEYTTENLRLMIGQEIGLHYLVPLAIEKLQDDLFVEGDFYPGDLLSNVLRIDSAFWTQYRGLYDQITRLIANRDDEIKEARISLEKFATDEKRC